MAHHGSQWKASHSHQHHRELLAHIAAPLLCMYCHEYWKAGRFCMFRGLLAAATKMSADGLHSHNTRGHWATGIPTIIHLVRVSMAIVQPYRKEYSMGGTISVLYIHSAGMEIWHNSYLPWNEPVIVFGMQHGFFSHSFLIFKNPLWPTIYRE